jgi:NitT/TauT family transport system substrate-binding protein
MGKFIIQPHGRPQEWIAHEKGYFHDEGLDYEFVRGPSADTQKSVDASGKVTDLMSGAFESYKHAGGNKGVKSDISCACHLGRESGVRAASRNHVGQVLCCDARRNHGAT